MRADGVEPNAENASEAELLVAMEAAPNQRSYRRLAAIRALLKGYSRAQVAELFGRSERLVRLWILCFNEGGVDALASKPRPGRPRKIKLERLRDLLVPVLEEPAKAAQEHWTGVKVHGWLKEQLAIALGSRRGGGGDKWGKVDGRATTIRYLHELDYHLRVPQRWPERQDEAERAAFLEALHALQEDPAVELWHGDECGVEGDPRPRRRWSARGRRPRVPLSGRSPSRQRHRRRLPQDRPELCPHLRRRRYRRLPVLFGSPRRSHPPEPGKRRILILDNASWHKATRLCWHHFECRFLPGYSPDFNPIERLWLRLKADYFSDFIARTPEELTERLCTALDAFMDDTKKVAGQCANRK